MNWTLIFTISALCLTVVVTILTYKDKKKAAFWFTLGAALVNGISAFNQKKDYSSKIPAVTASVLIDSVIRLTVVDVDEDLPIKDVSYRFFDKSGNLGVLYPLVANVIGDFAAPRESMTWVMVLWYNGTESMEIDFDITRTRNSKTEIRTKYFKKGIEFEPEWLIKARGSNDTTTRHYDPTMFR